MSNAPKPIAIALLGLAGCAAMRPSPAPRIVSLAEFAQRAPIVAVADAPAPEADAAGGGAATSAEDETGPPVVTEVEVVEGPLAPPARSLEVGDSIIVDSLVGQVNGRPIYAYDFFVEISDQLRALGERSESVREFRLAASEIIRGRLSQVVLDELFLAEAESQLSPEQQQGLLAFMGVLREGVIGRAGGGTRAQAEQTLREQEGIGVEEYVQLQKDRELLRLLFQQKIESRVIVSWRDIEREYARRIDEFQPPPVARLSRIRLATQRDAERIAEVGTMLAEGAPFAEVAALVEMPDDGKWEQFELGPEGLAGIDLREEIKLQIVDLRVGQTSPPFEVGRSTWWLHIDAIERPPGRSIYDSDVQRSLTAQIRGRRLIEEQNRYIASLLAEGIYEDLQAMGQRLLQVAVDRYGPG